MRSRLLITFVQRGLILAGLWWLMAGGDVRSWLFGGPLVLALAAWRLEIGAKRMDPVSWSRLVVFIPYFVWRTLVGSLDVAWRAMHPMMPIAPAMVDYSLRLPVDSPARVFFCNCISLLPGTLCAAYEDDGLRVHVLTAGPKATNELRSLEWQVAMLFGISLSNCREHADQ